MPSLFLYNTKYKQLSLDLKSLYNQSIKEKIKNEKEIKEIVEMWNGEGGIYIGRSRESKKEEEKEVKEEKENNIINNINNSFNNPFMILFNNTLSIKTHILSYTPSSHFPTNAYKQSNTLLLFKNVNEKVKKVFSSIFKCENIDVEKIVFIYEKDGVLYLRVYKYDMEEIGPRIDFKVVE